MMRFSRISSRAHFCLTFGLVLTLTVLPTGTVALWTDSWSDIVSSILFFGETEDSTVDTRNDVAQHADYGEERPWHGAQDGSMLLPQDFRLAQSRPAEETTEEGLQAMQVPSLFEGDIMGIPFDFGDQRRLKDAVADDIFKYPLHSSLNLVTYPEKLWPDRRVPYLLQDGLQEKQRVAIAQAFDEYKNKTCVKFVPKKDSDTDYIYIMQNRRHGCSSYVGRAGGNQTISLEVDKCFTKGIVAHELMHSIGFFHEHSRTDRDKYVDILEDNIKSGMLRNFEKYPGKIIDSLGMPYDYESVMHYHKLAFSKNGKATIVPKDRSLEIGQRYRLSDIDSKKINKLYSCTIDGKPSEEVDTGGEESTTKPGTEKGAEKECEDLNAHCDMWSELGHCKWSQKYMSHYCRKSCAVCNEEEKVLVKPDGRCLDRNLFCGYWAKIGECKSESKFMKLFCRRSCEICTDG